MSLILNGNPANVTTPLVATVTSLSNNGSGAVRVTTSAPHLFGNGDLVQVVASPILGNFTIAVIGSNTFDLPGSVYTTTGTGTATDLSLTPQIQVPTDGDPASLQLSGMLSSLQALADRDQYLARLVQPNGYSMVLMGGPATTGGLGWPSWTSGTGPGGSWGAVPSSSFGLPGLGFRANTGDLLVIDFSTTVVTNTAAPLFSLGLAQQHLGLSTFTQQQGNGFLFPLNYVGPLSLSGKVLSLGQYRTAGTITAFSGGLATIGGLSGLSTDIVGASLTISGAANAANNGTFQITSRPSATSVQVANPVAVYPDANSGALTLFVDNFKFDIDVQVASLAVYTFEGDYQQQVTLYRPNNRMVNP